MISRPAPPDDRPPPAGAGRLDGVSESREQMRQAVRGVVDELGRAAEQAERLLRQAARDVADLAGESGGPSAGARGASAVELIRDLGRLRDEGLISEEEFAAKKADLLRRI